MFGSQALETAIGLTLLFLVFASAASAIVEAFSTVLQKRARDLEATLREMLAGTPDTPTKTPPTTETIVDAFDLFRGTTVYTAGLGATRQVRWIYASKARPAYLSARSFADAVIELLASAKLGTAPLAGWQGLSDRLDALTAEAEQDLVHVKAGLESWFDETMSRLGNAYKRWAAAALFVVGLVIACLANFSTINVAEQLWEQPAVQQAALNAAAQAATKGAPSATLVADNVTSVEKLQDLALPIGWSSPPQWGDLGWLFPHLGGWLITALLLMLGAPFWFDVLSRLVSLRTSGVQPKPATQDEASATQLRTIAPGALATTGARDLLGSIAGQREAARAIGSTGPRPQN